MVKSQRRGDPYKPQRSPVEIIRDPTLTSNVDILDLLSHLKSFGEMSDIRIRMPPRLRQLLIAKAAQHGMTLNAYLLVYLYQTHMDTVIQFSEDDLLQERIDVTNQYDQEVIPGRSLEALLNYREPPIEHWEQEP